LVLPAVKSFTRWAAALLLVVAATRAAVPIEPSAEITPQTGRLLSGAPPRGAEDLRALQAQIRRIAAEVMPATVGIVVGAAHGSGVIISPDGYVLTAAHVAGQPGREARFVLSSGRVVRGESLGVNVEMDAGLMKIADYGIWPYAKMGDSTSVQSGQWCLATGHPGGYEGGRLPVLRIGRVTAKWNEAIRTDCTLESGDSGGPLFDMQGKVIGIHSRVGVPVATNLHVPVDVFVRDWDRFAAGELWGLASGPEPFLGVVRDPNVDGAAVLQVRAGSPAQRAGVQAGDVIVEYGGTQVKTFDELAEMVKATKPGQKVPIRIERNGKSIRLQIRIGGSNPDPAERPSK
jgi:serine protease Do